MLINISILLYLLNLFTLIIASDSNSDLNSNSHEISTIDLKNTIKIENKLQEFDQCSIPSKLISTSSNQICKYIEKNCDSKYFKISKLYYCKYNHNLNSLIIISGIILLSLCLILLSLSILVSNYLFKNLNELTLIFGLNNQILSFILIPLTNSFPDLINYYIVLESGNSNLIIGQLMGSILIMFTIIIGFISIMNKSYVVEQPKLLIIDLSWILIVLILFSYILSDGKITKIECLIMSIVYISYIIFLSVFDKEKIKEFDEELLISCDDHQHIIEQPYNIEDALDIISNDERQYGSIQTISRSPSPRSCSPINSRSPSPIASPIISPRPIIESLKSQEIIERQNEFLSVNYIPRDKSPSTTPFILSRSCSYHHQQKPKLLTLIFQYICNCIDFILIFLIPFHRCIENEDSKWKSYIRHNKLMTIWYFFEIPLLINYQFFQIELNYLIVGLIITFPIVFTFNLIKHNIKIIIISILGIITSLIVVSNISILILQILKNLGLIWKISDYILGLLVFSISNSINDVITNITLATKINPILGINSCLGTPLLIILLGIGFNGFLVIQQSSSHKSIKFDLKPSVILSTTSLIVTIVFILIYLPSNKWTFDRKLGIGLVGWYFLIAFTNLYLE
ncbi:uncharacterized protein KGF55_004005 [Candida pseudojiufengensis]|uniref:uncharacterized protein n=1 Tax=Candida pseudojiufengensis TaxID=497109 RepID=UPI002225A288|nr:uncharacterized protein KGF55_004005 [Candida pseudojiufengensis]KAI5961382.1 hypothetical protein KGF55_004005 [Candida pseudojiufengensis]